MNFDKALFLAELAEAKRIASERLNSEPQLVRFNANHGNRNAYGRIRESVIQLSNSPTALLYRDADLLLRVQPNGSVEVLRDLYGIYQPQMEIEMRPFDPNEFNRLVNIALRRKDDQDYFVRFNESHQKNYGYVAEDTLLGAGFAEMKALYEYGNFVVRVSKGMIYVVRDTGGYSSLWQFVDTGGEKPTQQAPTAKAPATPAFELPWQQREREAAEQKAAIVALREKVRSTLGM